MASVKRFSPLPGFGLAMGYTLVYLTLVVLIPLTAVGTKTLTMGLDAFWAAVSTRASWLPINSASAPRFSPPRSTSYSA